jgi:hypothetical protein
MTEQPAARPHDEDDWYEIRIQGRLDKRWATWFDGMLLSCDRNGTTVLRGHVTDQAALHGLLTKVRDIGLPLLAVVRGSPAPPTQSGTPPEPRPRQEPPT